jgi:hypothetical protein
LAGRNPVAESYRVGLARAGSLATCGLDRCSADSAHTAAARTPASGKGNSAAAAAAAAGRVASCKALMPMPPQHPADRGINIVIEQEPHYPAAAKSRDASATSAALRSGNASKIAPVS